MTVASMSVGEEMNPSRRHTMEDSHVVLEPGSWKSPDPNMTFMAVYDGHGGECQAERASLNRVYDYKTWHPQSFHSFIH